MKAKKWILATKFGEQPKESDLQIVEEDLPQLQENEILCEAVYLSVDPYMRSFLWNAEVGSTVFGEQLSKVIESRNEDYPAGSFILGHFGWRTHTIANPYAKPGKTQLQYKLPNLPRLVPVPPLGDLPMSAALGAVGMPGGTAFFGLTKLLEPKPGEVVLVNAAGGAVGNVVGQIAKIQGCKVVGCAGTDAKCAWLKEDLGFDYAFNYKTADVSAALKEAAPEGFDCYFDNVGGHFTSSVLSNHMKMFGRVAMCGCIADRTQKHNPPNGRYPWSDILSKQLTIRGFIGRRWRDEWDAAIKQLIEWVQQGKLKNREHVTEGFDSMASALFGMLNGENIGKAVVKV